MIQASTNASGTTISPATWTTPFGVVRGESPQLAAAEVALAERAMRFVTLGLMHHDAVPTDAFESALKVHFLDGMAGGGIVLDSKMYKRMESNRSHDDFARMAWISLVRSTLEFASRLMLPSVVPLVCLQLDSVEAMAIVSEMGGRVAAGDSPMEELGSKGLAGAWEMARINVDRAEARLSVLFALHDAMRGRRERLESSTAAEQFTRLHLTLSAARQQALLKMFAIGTVVGESAAPHLKARSKEMFGPGRSIVELLCLDGHAPGFYPSGVDDALRAAFDRA